MGLLDSVTPGVGALGAGLLGFLGGQSTNEQNADIARQNNAWSAHQFATRYQTTVKDLQAAGLNPMLAYSQGGGSPPTAQQVQFQNPVSSAIQAYQGAASAAQSFSSASQADATVKQVEASTNKIVEETKNIPLEGDKIRYTIQKLAEEAANIAQKTQSEVITQRLISQQVAKLKSETSLLNNQVAVEQELDNLGRKSQQIKPLIDILRSILK